MRKPPVLTPLAGNLQARQTTVPTGGPPKAGSFLISFRAIR